MAGQTRVTVNPGVVTSGQMAEALLVTRTALQASLAVTVTALLIEHASSGALKLAVKLVEAPGARLGTIKSVLEQAVPGAR